MSLTSPDFESGAYTNFATPASRTSKELSPDTVVVMISGMQTVESAIGALRLGAFDYLMKPFDLRQVEAVVKRALEHYDLVVAKQRYENHLEELVEQRTVELDQSA
jgi:putative two-component system response regulator